ncbi:hypothetical protein TCAL_05929 [Tigriopus californicus]|uniref:Cytosol aminopeptidase domain-containing protein n=1 Tax=Tigriopus californicus TaxID=6832 RepID=A0A553NZS9_TIGCA|nr:hypothetical protein TCAL_05929 [Tigriopus californicus]
MGTGRFNAGVDSVELLVRQLSRDGRPYRDGLMALGALAALRLGYLSSRFMWRLVRQMAGPWTGSQPQAVDFSARCGQWAVLINPCKGLGFALALALAQRHVNLLLVDFNEHALELFKEYIQTASSGHLGRVAFRASWSAITTIATRTMTSSSSFPTLPRIELCSDLQSADYDGIVVVSHSVSDLPFGDLQRPLATITAIDKKAEDGLFIAPCQLPAKRIIYSSTGKLDQDSDDVRRYAEAAEKGVARAIEAGCQSPCLLFNVKSQFAQAGIVAALGGLKALYVPLEMREAQPDKAKKVTKIGIFGSEDRVGAKIELVRALEAGRIVSRDVGGSDPERMAAPRVEEYIRQTFENTGIKIEVIQGQPTFEQEYPCFAAVNRCASSIPRHDGRIIWLTYEPEGPVEKTLMLVGKGVTYDTGGLDIKAGGIMAGMCRDKCGAADVAGILKAVSILKPKNVKVVGALAMVRNSCGSDGYVSDEIITTRAGVRLRVGNTDAEGRMAMADVLCHMKEKALNEVNPHLMTIATLTGHAARTYGDYTAIMDNGPAKKDGCSRRIQDISEEFGNPFEVSTIRREDFEHNKDKCGDYVDLLQCNVSPGNPSSRGHQWAGAFLVSASGLDKHMVQSEKPLKYSHLDIAGSSGSLPGPNKAPTVVPLISFTQGSEVKRNASGAKRTNSPFLVLLTGECDGKIEIISVTCGLKLHSENLAAQEIAETIRKMNIRLLFNICGFPHKEHQKSADDISMTPQISSFLTFHSKIALTSQLIFEMLVQSQRNENGSTVFNIGAYYPNYGSQDWTEFRALQSYGTGLQELSERDGSKSRLNIVGVQYINYFTRNGSAASSIWSSYMGYLLPTAKSYATSLLAKLERGREHQLAVSWRHSMIMGILNLCPYLYFPSP